MIYINTLICSDQFKHVVIPWRNALAIPLKPQPLHPSIPHAITGFFNWITIYTALLK